MTGESFTSSDSPITSEVGEMFSGFSRKYLTTSMTRGGLSVR
ncbi:hypothetical protein [Bradyrhizobium sp. 41S5]|nr:hypothetical protein [Bradyrhizobium sp. 41S5]